MRLKNELYDFVGLINGETPAAVRVNHGGHDPFWLPKSQIEYVKTPDGKAYEFTVPVWLAKEKGII